MGEDCPLGQTKSCRKYGKIIKKNRENWDENLEEKGNIGKLAAAVGRAGYAPGHFTFFEQQLMDL